MKTLGLLWIVFAACCATVAWAQTYKWVDQSGRTTYGEKPPAGVKAVPIETVPPGNPLPAGPVEPKPVAKETVREVVVVPAPAPSRAMPEPRGLPFEVYIRLEVGMSEGELMLRAGRPDHIGVDSRWDNARSFYYYPTSADPYITTVTVRGGRIVNLERARKTF